jgi:hypothetical protein
MFAAAYFGGEKSLASSGTAFENDPWIAFVGIECAELVGCQPGEFGVSYVRDVLKAWDYVEVGPEQAEDLGHLGFTQHAVTKAWFAAPICGQSA